MASMTSGRWSMHRPTVGCSMPPRGWTPKSPRWRCCGKPAAAPARALDDHRAGVERAAREAEYLRHASDELKQLAPQDGEETALAERRATMMAGEKIAADLREAQDVVSGMLAGERAGGGGAAAGTASREFAATGRAGGAGLSMPLSTRWRRQASISRRRSLPPISTRPSWSASRNGCSRCARRRANMRRRSMAWLRLPRNTLRKSR